MIIFIAIPSEGTVVDGHLSSEFLKKLADLHIQYPEHTFISPMVQDYALLPYMSVDATWEKWGQHCRNLISVSDEVWVLMYLGYNRSTGVAGELQHAAEWLKPIRYVEV